MSARIAVFLPSLAGGGAERMMLNLARGVTEHGYRVELVLSRAEGPYLADVPPGVQLVDLEAGKTPGYAAIGSLLPLRQYLRRTRPDVLLSAMSRINVVAVLAARFSSATPRVVVSERNHLSSYVEGSDEFGVWTLPWLVRASYPFADAVVPNSRGVADDLSETAGIDRESMTVVNNPTVTPEIADRATEPVDDEWFDTGGPPVVLGVGSFSPQKDFTTLVDAFARVSDDRDARLVILGEGETESRVEQRVREHGLGDRVQFPGFVDNPYRYMSRADVFVLSSRWEGFPNALIEALACGAPVVATDCPSGPAEILSDGVYGSLVPVGDSEAMAAAVCDVLDDTHDPDRLRDRADEFSYDVIAEQFLEVLLPEEQ